MRFVVAMFVILMASPTVWGQSGMDAAEAMAAANGFGPFTVTDSQLLEFIISKTRDAADTVTKLEAAAEEVELNKPPHFGTSLSEAADQYKKATMNIDVFGELTFPSSPLTLTHAPITRLGGNPQEEALQIQSLQKLLGEMRMKQELGIEMRAQLDAEITLTDRKLKAALRAKEILEKALNPAAESGNVAAKWWADVDDLATAIGGYKSALDRRRQSMNAALSQLFLQIQNGQSWVALLEQDTWNQFWSQLKLNAALQEENNRLRQQYEPNRGWFGLSIPAGGQTNAAEHDAEGKQTGPNHDGDGPSDHSAPDHAQGREPKMLESGPGHEMADTHGNKDGSGVEVHSKP